MSASPSSSVSSPTPKSLRATSSPLDTLNVEVDQLRQTRTRRSADLESVRAEIDELRRQDEALEREIERHEKLRSELLDALQQKAQKLNLNK